MSEKDVALVVEKLLSDDAFRDAFQVSVEDALATSGLSLQPAEVQALLAQTAGDAEGLRAAIDNLAAAPTQRADVEVICTCGKGYWAQL